MIVFLLEEESMRPVIDRMISTLHSDWVDGFDWLVLAFNGKSDLEKNIRPKMEGWGYNESTFIIVRDNDGGDCVALKERLVAMATNGSGHPFKVRIVCQELEAWFLGDLDAVERAYPGCGAAGLTKRAKYRIPDAVGNAASEIATITGESGKVGRAKQIAAELSLDEEANRSASFGLMLRTIRGFNQ